MKCNLHGNEALEYNHHERLQYRHQFSFVGWLRNCLWRSAGFRFIALGSVENIGKNVLCDMCENKYCMNKSMTTVISPNTAFRLWNYFPRRMMLFLLPYIMFPLNIFEADRIKIAQLLIDIVRNNHLIFKVKGCYFYLL